MLPDSPGDAVEGSHAISVSDVHRLLNQGLLIQLQLESLQRLQAVLQQHQTWDLRMKQILEGMPAPCRHALMSCIIAN